MEPDARSAPGGETPVPPPAPMSRVPVCRPTLCVRDLAACDHGAARPCVACACQAVAAGGESVTGTVMIHRRFPSAHLDEPRDVWVYLPPRYASDGAHRYPVLYAQDGNNLFSAATAFAGQEWGLDETAEALIGSGLLSPVVIVGVANTASRVAEYTWFPDGAGVGGGGPRYLRFLREELKPFIDAVYTTRTDRLATGVLGSSLGGLLALYLGAHGGDAFGMLGAMSPSLWWADRRALADMATVRDDLRIWLDMGGHEGEDPADWAGNLDAARRLARVLAARGYRAGVNFTYWEAAEDAHDEGAWGLRAAQALRFLLARART